MRKSIMLLIAITALIGASSADAGTAYNLGAQRLDSDSFDNYDFQSASVSSTNIDQPVTLFFANNADVAKIKSALSGRYLFSGSDQWGRLDNSFGWFYDGDGGRKTGPGCSVWDVHYRPYADPAHSNRMYSPSQGFYVIATTHYDYNEGCGASYGWNEEAEQDVWATVVGNLGWTAVRNLWDMQNSNQPGRWDGCCHYYDNNSTATYFGVP
jgi:hypothetical protein